MALYLIIDRGNTCVKVGFSENEKTLKKRMSSYDTHAPFIELLDTTFDYGAVMEAKIHSIMNTSEIFEQIKKSEWYKTSSEVLETIIKQKFQYFLNDDFLQTEFVDTKELFNDLDNSFIDSSLLNLLFEHYHKNTIALGKTRKPEQWNEEIRKQYSIKDNPLFNKIFKDSGLLKYMNNSLVKYGTTYWQLLFTEENILKIYTPTENWSYTNLSENFDLSLFVDYFFDYLRYFGYTMSYSYNKTTSILTINVHYCCDQNLLSSTEKDFCNWVEKEFNLFEILRAQR